MKSTRRSFRPFLPLVALAACAGCVAGPPTPVARDFGLAHRLSIVNQTLRPEAAENAAAPEELSGVAGKSAYDRYRESFAVKPAAPPALSIRVTP